MDESQSQKVVEIIYFLWEGNKCRSRPQNKTIQNRFHILRVKVNYKITRRKCKSIIILSWNQEGPIHFSLKVRNYKNKRVTNLTLKHLFFNIIKAL